MRKLILAVAAMTAAACSDSPSPAVMVAGNPSRDYVAPSNPPPPPLDSGSYSSSEYGTSSRINITYFLNRPGTHGWLTFQKSQEAGTLVDRNARISYSKGEVSGTGTLSYLVPQGRVSIDLASVSDRSTFANSDRGYFNLIFNAGTFTDAGGKTVPLSRSTSLGINPPKDPCTGDRICPGN